MHVLAQFLVVTNVVHSVAALHQPALQKKMYIYTCSKKILYAKLTYCDYPNKNFEHPNLRITKICVQQN